MTEKERTPDTPKDLSQFDEYSFALDGIDKEIFVLCAVLDAKGGGIPPDEVHEAPKSFQLLRKRLRVFRPDAKASDALMLAVASLCDRPAQCVMWAYTLARGFDAKRKSGNNEPLDMKWLPDAFPAGLPTEETYKSCWEAQKIKSQRPVGNSDNALDNMLFWLEAPSDD